MSVQPRNTADIAKVIARRREGVIARQETWALVRRVLLVAAVAFIILTQVFLVTQVEGNGMYPAMKDGDLALVYRLQGQYARNDVIVYQVDGVRYFGRVVARAGDEVSITENGSLLINSQLESGERPYPKTPTVDGEPFRCVVEVGYVYVLGDFRIQAENDQLVADDSREFGPIPLSDVEGKVITLLRRRGL